MVGPSKDLVADVAAASCEAWIGFSCEAAVESAEQLGLDKGTEKFNDYVCDRICK